MSQPETKEITHGVMRTLAISTMLAAALAGCSDLYYARRDTLVLSAGDSVAANAAEQMYDPWPPYSGNPNIAFNGQKMQTAVERYRNDKVTPPTDALTLDIMQPGPAATTTVNVSQAPATPPTTQPTQ
jgi:hypothetical protein